jgi:carbon-monoxide dehydrogenase medium subunit
VSEAALAGREIDGESLRELRANVAEELDPYDDVHATADYRRHAAGVIVARAVAELWERSGL